MPDAEKQFIHELSGPVSTLLLILGQVESSLKCMEFLAKEADESAKALDLVRRISALIQARRAQLSAQEENDA